MEDYIVTGLSLLMPCLLAIYGHYAKKKCDATLVIIKAPVKYFTS